jgi:hypothetical protein
MGFFNDLSAAVRDYPRDNVKLDFVQVMAPGTAMNVDETVQFKIKVINEGPLTLKNVQLHIKGERGTKVRAASTDPWVDEIQTGSLTVAGDGSEVSPAFYFKPTQEVEPAAQLLSANISAWNADLGRILNGYSNGGPYPSANFIHEVEGS